MGCKKSSSASETVVVVSMSDKVRFGYGLISGSCYIFIAVQMLVAIVGANGKPFAKRHTTQAVG